MTIEITSKKFIATITVLLALLTAMSPLAIDTYLSAMPVMSKFFGVGIHKIEFSLTLYFLGFAIGNFIGGPLSDSFGRKTIALTGIVIYSTCAFLIPQATSIEHVWILRFLQAFGGGFGSVVAMVFVKDWYHGKQVARIGTIISMIMMLAPLFAPVIGGVLLEFGQWKLIFYFLGIYSTIIFLLFAFVMPESRSKEHITRKVKVNGFVANYKTFFKSKRAVYMLICTSLSAAAMFTFITSASFIYIEYFGYSSASFPVLFGANVILNVLLSFVSTRMLKRREPHQLLRTGLLLQLVGGSIILISVLTGNPTFIWIFSSIVIIVGSLGMIFGNGVAIILNEVPEISGAANASIGVVRFIISFIMGSIPALFHSGNLKPIGIVIFLCILSGNFFYWLFVKTKKD